MDCNIEISWEEIYNNNNEPFESPFESHFEATYRARVSGGWLVRHIISYQSDEEDEKLSEGWLRREVSMVFVPDIDNSWHHPMRGVI
jgi:hypothetical protein